MDNRFIEHVDNSDILGEGFGIFTQYRCQSCGAVNMVANIRTSKIEPKPYGIPIVPFTTKVEKLVCRACHFTTEYNV